VRPAAAGYALAAAGAGRIATGGAAPVSTFGAATVELRAAGCRADLPGTLIDSPFLRQARQSLPEPDRADWPDNPRRFGLLGWVGDLGSSVTSIATGAPTFVHGCQRLARRAACAHLAPAPGPRRASVLSCVVCNGVHCGQTVQVRPIAL